MVKYLLLILSFGAYAADNSIYVTQAGDGNTVYLTQDGSGHTATVNLGTTSNVDNTSVSIEQKDAAKTAVVENKSGINNSFNILQQGAGNHYAGIQNFIGSGNNVSVDQNGSGTHSFTITNPSNNTNSGNTVTATQSGGSGANKTFNLALDGATGASATIIQTNPTQSNTGTMSISCASGSCGSYSYIRY